MPLAPTDPVTNLADLVTRAAERGPTHVGLLDAASGDAQTWAQVDAAVNCQAAGLVEAGVKPGDRVAVRLPTGIGYCLAVFAVLRAGGVVVPMSMDLPPLAVREQLADCAASVLIGDPVEGVEIPVRESGREPGPPMESIGGGEDIALLCYTSGTSGASRGVLLSHRALAANAAQCAALRPAPVTAADRVLIALPLTHAYGLGPGLLQATSAGATAVLLPAFGVESALTAIERYRVTTMVGVPQMYQALLSVPVERLREALATVRLFTSGAAPLPPQVLTEMWQVTGLPVYEGYGLTETGPVVTSTLVSGEAKAGSVGRPLPGVEVRLVDSDGDPLPGPDETDLLADERNGTGLVSVRGANLFSGYWPDRTHGPAEDGWFRTGDIGYLDADGDLHLVDRAGDLIIVNGFNVYPHEVERVLLELAGVTEAAVVGVPDKRTGEAVKAVLVTSSEVTAEEVREHCALRLARFKVPTTVEFVESLPYSATGKVARRKLR